MYQSDLKHENAMLEDKLHALYALRGSVKIELGFRPAYLQLLEKLGNPQNHLPPVIHVAGTNGKGSTIAFMRAILEAAGLRVHVYTSPHLIRFNERIVLAGQDIANDILESLIDEVLALNDGADITFFEITTAIAFAAFARTPADITLVEVGLGGRLDCTNVIEAPLLSVITPISKDHSEFLGETLQQIAGEKAGIMKSGVPCITAPQSKEINATLEEKSKESRAPLLRHGHDWRIQTQGDAMTLHLGGNAVQLPHPNLTGAHQINNAGLAAAALSYLNQHGALNIPPDAYVAGLRNAHWRARLQPLPSALLSADAQGWELWLDGGHNEDAGRALAAQAQLWSAQDPRPLHLVLAMMKHKDPRGFLAPLLPHLHSIRIIDIPDEPHSLQSDALSALIRPLAPDLPIESAPDLQSACNAITGASEGAGRILIGGSLYLAGHVLHMLEKAA